MGLFLRRRPEPATEARSYPIGQLLPFLTGYPGGGHHLSTDQALRASAVWACLRVLAGSASMLPVDVVRMDGRRRVPLTTQPPVVDRPSALVERDVWVHQLVWSMYTDGNAWGMITGHDFAGRPTSIETVAGDMVTSRCVRDGVPRVRIEGEEHKLYPHGDVWHVPGPMVPAGSPFGLSPISYGSTGIDATLLAETFGADFFGAGGHPTTLIYSDDPNLTAGQAADIKRAYLTATDGREPAVLGAGLKHETVQVDPDDSQFIDLLRFEVENACRFMGVPPSMVYGSVSGQSVTYANISQYDLHYLKHSLEVPLGRLERAWGRLIARPQIVRINRDALLRSDAAARWAVYQQRLDLKTISVNQVLALEDEAPFDDPAYDEPGVPSDTPHVEGNP